MRLLALNKYLKYFLKPAGCNNVTSLGEDELVEILDRAKPIKYHWTLLMANYDPSACMIMEYSQYLERLKASTNIEKALRGLDD